MKLNSTLAAIAAFLTTLTTTTVLYAQKSSIDLASLTSHMNDVKTFIQDKSDLLPYQVADGVSATIVEKDTPGTLSITNLIGPDDLNINIASAPVARLRSYTIHLSGEQAVVISVAKGQSSTGYFKFEKDQPKPPKAKVIFYEDPIDNIDLSEYKGQFLEVPYGADEPTTVPFRISAVRWENLNVLPENVVLFCYEEPNFKGDRFMIPFAGSGPEDNRRLGDLKNLSKAAPEGVHLRGREGGFNDNIDSYHWGTWK